MEKPGLQEMIKKNKMTLDKTPRNFGLFIFELLTGGFLGK
jgi:hypothetical protein